MAAMVVSTGELLLIQISNGASPTPTYAHKCAINADRSFELTANMVATPIPDCDNPTAPAVTANDVESYSASISGSGLFPAEDEKFWAEWLTSGVGKNVRVKNQTSGTGHWEGVYKCSQFSITGTRKNKITCSISLVLDGSLTRIDPA